MPKTSAERVSTAVQGAVLLNDPVDSPETAESVPRPTGVRSLLKKVSVGARGPRAGWKDLLFFLIVFVVGFFLRHMTGKLGPRPTVLVPGPMLLRELRGVMAMLIALAETPQRWFSTTNSVFNSLTTLQKSSDYLSSSDDCHVCQF